jgi:hypothetical protein
MEEKQHPPGNSFSSGLDCEPNRHLEQPWLFMWGEREKKKKNCNLNHKVNCLKVN